MTLVRPVSRSAARRPQRPDLRFGGGTLVASPVARGQPDLRRGPARRRPRGEDLGRRPARRRRGRGVPRGRRPPPADHGRFRPGRAGHLGVLVDHLCPVEESRIAAGLAQPGVLIVGHPFIDIWQAVPPSVSGSPARPTSRAGYRGRKGCCRPSAGTTTPPSAGGDPSLGAYLADLEPELWAGGGANRFRNRTREARRGGAARGRGGGGRVTRSGQALQREGR